MDVHNYLIYYIDREIFKIEVVMCWKLSIKRGIVLNGSIGLFALVSEWARMAEEEEE